MLLRLLGVVSTLWLIDYLYQAPCLRTCSYAQIFALVVALIFVIAVVTDGSIPQQAASFVLFRRKKREVYTPKLHPGCKVMRCTVVEDSELF